MDSKAQIEWIEERGHSWMSVPMPTELRLTEESGCLVIKSEEASIAKLSLSSPRAKLAWIVSSVDRNRPLV